MREWRRSVPPARILVIRLHAIGDVALTLPATTALSRTAPGSCIDFLTGEPARSLVASVEGVSHVFALELSARRLATVSDTIATAQRLAGEGYDLVLDLQRNWRSRLIRRIIRPEAWAEFDRWSAKAAAERVASTFREAGFPSPAPLIPVTVRPDLREEARVILRRNGWDGKTPLYVLNPAGLWPSRSWPLERYVELARLWVRREAAKFLILGLDAIRDKARAIRQELGDIVYDLTGQTSPGLAMGLLQLSSGIVTEDSGLMHMAWACGIPTVALFGSSNHVWSAPQGPHCKTIHSGDLPCGACMEPVCRFGDTHCLGRVEPEEVVALMASLREHATARVDPGDSTPLSRSGAETMDRSTL